MSISPHEIRELSYESKKLDQIAIRLRTRDSSLFNECTKAIDNGDHRRAKMYANELAQVRTMLNAIKQSKLAIECTVIRLENYLELQTLFKDLKPTIADIRGLTHHVAKVMPEMTRVMEQLNVLVNSALIETTLDSPSISLPLTVKSLESEEILDEVAAHLEQKLERALPEPPSLTVARKVAVKSKEERKAIPLAAG